MQYPPDNFPDQRDAASFIIPITVLLRWCAVLFKDTDLRITAIIGGEGFDH
jgi:hypothetical protein